jgi:hypothetical protein
MGLRPASLAGFFSLDDLPRIAFDSGRELVARVRTGREV